jgi:CRP-like cAMP-binding protein
MQEIVTHSHAGRRGHNELLALLPASELSLLASLLMETNLERGTVLQPWGQPIARVYFPQGGSVSLLGILPGGTAIETAAIGSEGAVGLNTAIGSQVASSLAVVQNPGRFAHMSASAFAELAGVCKPVHDMVVRYNEFLFAQIQQNVVCNAVHDAQARLCRWLLHARERTGDDTLPYTQEYLAGILGLQRTTVTFICRILQSEGTLVVRRARTQIKDLAALERRACACHGIMRRLSERLHGSFPQDLRA